MNRLPSAAMLIALMIIISCEKQDTDINSEVLVLKSHEITAYVYQDHDGILDHSVVVPWKIYAKGGSPDHQTGDYTFRVAEGSTLPGGLSLDGQSGVIKGSGIAIEPISERKEFDIEVTDGVVTQVNKFTLDTQYIIKGARVSMPGMQFNSPETKLLCNLGAAYYGVSLSMLGGVPPYNFSLMTGSKLPGKLTLNSLNGVISGSMLDVPAGFYTFRVQCTDSQGRLALSMCTTARYEEFTIIVK